MQAVLIEKKRRIIMAQKTKPAEPSVVLEKIKDKNIEKTKLRIKKVIIFTLALLITFILRCELPKLLLESTLKN